MLTDADDRGRVEEMAERVMELDGKAGVQMTGDMTIDQLQEIEGARRIRDSFYRTAAPALAAEVTRLTKELADAMEWQEEIRGAIDRSGMGIMRTSQGPSGTMLGYRPEVDEEHQRKTLEVIHENVDLQCEVRRLKEQLSTLTASENPKEPSKV